MTRALFYGTLATSLFSLASAPALAGSASDCGTNCQLQAELDALRSQVDELSRKVDAGSADKKTFTQSGGTGIELKLSGQVNRGLLVTDDGDSTEEFFVDNDNSSTRFRFTGSGDINPDTRMGVNFEVEIQSNPSDGVNQNDKTVGGDNFDERKLEWYIDSKRFGKLSLGQGDMASNGSSEADLSGTGVAASSDVKDLAGGILFFDEVADTLSTVRITDPFDNFDGLSRRDRVRYDTPEFMGFKLSGSAGDSGRWDFAGTYDNEIGDFAIEAAAALANDDDDENRYSGSASILHKTSGISLTGAVASDERDAFGDDALFYYIKLGWQTKALTPLGKTAFSIDFSENEDTFIDGDEATSYGIFAVQKIDRVGTEFYIGARNHEYDAPGRDFDDIFAFVTGARVKF